MRIAQIVCTLPPYGGGIGVVAHYYAEELVNRGHEVVVFKPRPKKKKDDYERNFEVQELRPVVEIGHGAILFQLLWKLKNFDVVHLHFPFVGASLFVYLLKLLKGDKLKLVLSYHMDLVGKTGWRKGVFEFYNRHFLQRIIKKADKIVVAAVDYTEYSNIRKYYQENKKKFVEIPFGVNKMYQPESKNPSLLAKYKFSSEDTIITFVGGLDSAHYFKGVDYLIKAIAKINNPTIKALIVGEGNLKKKFQQLAKDLGVEKRVVFAGYVPNDLLVDHYNLGDMHVLASIDQSEAFGLVLIEAMACGKPLIASNLKGVRSVVIPGENGILVEPKNARDIANKIIYLYDHPEMMEKFRVNGLNMVAQKYRWPIVAEHLEEVYKELLK